MGSRSVGSLQYNTTNMMALASVEVSDECGSCTFFHQRREPTKKTAKQKQAGSDKDRNAEIQSTESQVRRRKAEENGPEESELEERIQELSIEEVTIQDPLKWFGILVPAALRQGQNNFIEAVEQCVEIATLQNKLMATQLEYQELMKTKMELNDKTENLDDTEEGETNVGRTG
ncbi:putative coiled-coil domain-containing protein [Apostichopus japonicus]|uniref:Vacuolar ATPase assembly protein VMA22 n=1 Tax=Stichopus japonicus TaxID=307972 RepID=A0A2G8JWW8_STIJA|nr:putative coiled-coil domain-containing protein [Apostichopus japonicus]